MRNSNAVRQVKGQTPDISLEVFIALLHTSWCLFFNKCKFKANILRMFCYHIYSGVILDFPEFRWESRQVSHTLLCSGLTSDYVQGSHMVILDFGKMVS